MNSLIPSSMTNISLIPGPAFIVSRCNNCTTRQNVHRVRAKLRFNVPRSGSLRLFPHNRLGLAIQYKPQSHHVTLATGTDVAVEEPGSPVMGDDSGESAEAPTEPEAEPAPAQAKRSRGFRKSEMPPVKNEELIPGATFTGKVRSVQPFGAFVDFGAFTDGLVHVSQLSNSFIKDVGSVVSVGQEVTVKLLEANSETGRISLTMREGDDAGGKTQQQAGSTPTGDNKPRPPRKNAGATGQRKSEPRKTSKFVKGQELTGTIKNLTRSGAFVTLPEGEEGFLPQSEEADGGLGSMMGSTSLEVGQEVTVRVLRIARGQVTLTMKAEEDLGKLDAELSQGVVYAAMNPFVLAFQKNKEIAVFLNGREAKESTEVNEPTASLIAEAPAAADEPKTDESNEKDSTPEASEPAASLAIEEAPATVEQNTDDSAPSETASDLVSDDAPATDEPEIVESVKSESEDTAVKDEGQLEEPVAEVVQEVSAVEKSETEEVAVEDKPEPEDAVVVKDEGKVEQTVAEVTEEVSGVEKSEIEEAVVEDKTEPEDAVVVKDEGKVEETVAEVTEEAVVEDESKPEDAAVEEEPQVSQTVAEATEKVTIEDEKSEDGVVVVKDEGIVEAVAEVTEEVVVEEKSEPEVAAVNEEPQGAQTVAEATEEVAIEDKIKSEDEVVVANDEGKVEETTAEVTDEVKDEPQVTENVVEVAEEVTVEDKSTAEENESKVVEEPKESLLEESVATAVAELSSDATLEEKDVVPTPQGNGTIAGSNGQANADLPKQGASISPALVKQLREETGAGMMDCKKALAESGGDIIKAQEFLRKKGLASAEKKAARATAEGRIGSYIHDSRIGVLVEVNCETDFVSRGEIFKELVDDLAMQVAACPQVQYLATDEVPAEIVNKEKEIEMQKEDLLSKPENMRERIVDGRIKKRLEELALLEQPYIKSDKVAVKDWVKQTIATVGENIKVKRFVRFNLGEGLEKKSQDFAAEVAAQTAAKAPPTPSPASAEQKPETPVAPKAAVSAALVKQLREETGAGMMDCKKALAETGGDLEKAQEYLRKKGLSTADKKSSRLAAEGRIGSYIHDSRIGVLLEVNCETDFVGRSEKFKELVDDLAMQVVACPLVQYVSVEDVPEEIVKKEKELEMQREDLQSKPENIREKIVEGRVSKRLGELALLEQAFIKDDSILVKDLVKQTVAALGENIKVRRFARFTLGESTEKDAKTDE